MAPRYLQENLRPESLEKENISDFIIIYSNKVNRLLLNSLRYKQKFLKTLLIDEINLLIEKYFKKRNILKRINISGAIKANKGLNALMSHIFTMVSLSQFDRSFSSNDIQELEGLRSEVSNLLDLVDTQPVQIIVSRLESSFRGLVTFIPAAAKTEYNSLVNQLMLVNNFNQAWSIGLRIKGLIYESFFASTWGLEYVPEDLKNTLLDVVRQNIQGAVSLFIDRTVNVPEIREFKPDFVLVQKPKTKGPNHGFPIIMPKTIPYLEGKMNKKMGRFVNKIERDAFQEKEVFDLSSAPGFIKPDNGSSTDESDTGLNLTPVASTQENKEDINPEKHKRKVKRHELGQDEQVSETVDSIGPLVRKVIQYGIDHNTQGGIITETVVMNSNDISEFEEAKREESKEMLIDSTSGSDQVELNSIQSRMEKSIIYEKVDQEQKRKNLMSRLIENSDPYEKEKRDDKESLINLLKSGGIDKTIGESKGEDEIIDDTLSEPAIKNEFDLEAKIKINRELDREKSIKPQLPKKTWKDVKFEEKTETYEVLLIEVGYQTDREGKIQSDLTKWNTAISILNSIGVKTTVISAVDSTENEDAKWWLTETQVGLIRSSISRLFRALQDNTPIDISEHIISDISSQKMRMSLQTGKIVRPPTTSTDIQRFYKQWRESFIIRPTGTILPKEIESDIIQSLVFGATIKQDQEGARKVLESIMNSMDPLIDKFQKGPNAIYRTNEVSGIHFTIGWLEKELSHLYCDKCKNHIIKESEHLAERTKAVDYSKHINNYNPCKTCKTLIEQYDNRGRFNKDFLSQKTDSIFKNNVSDNIKSNADGPTTIFSEFDRVVSLLLPGKTQKQKRVKSNINKLKELYMIINDIPAIKDSKGQLFINQYYKRIQKNLEVSESSEKILTLDIQMDEVELNKEKNMGYEEEDEDDYVRISVKGSNLTKIINQFNSLARSVKQQIKDDYSTDFQEIISKFCDKPLDGRAQDSRCVIRKNWVESILKTIKIEEDSKLYLSRIIMESKSKAIDFIKDDSFQSITEQEVESYLSSKFEEVIWEPESKTIFTNNCILFNEILNEFQRRLAGTVYSEFVIIIVKLLEMMLNFKWFKRLVYYSKICQLFLQFCGETVHSGIKTKKIPHTNLNLIVKVPENKTSNMYCRVTDSNFETVDDQGFFLNKRVAVLGHSLPYCYMLCLLQELQFYNVTGVLSDNWDDLKQSYSRKLPSIYSNILIKNIMLSKTGETHTIDPRLEVQEKKFKTDKDDKSVFIQVLIGFNLSFGVLLGPSIALNSQNFNKQIQTIRFPFMLSLGEFGQPKSLGAKMFASSRRIETEVAKLWIRHCCEMGLSNPRQNIINWKKCTDRFPRTTLQSLSIFGSTVISDRQFAFDIYLVHIYNKELDDFGSGQIRVFEEFADKHKDWELDIVKSVQLIKNRSSVDEEGIKRSSQDINRQVKSGRHLTKLFLGIPELGANQDLYKSGKSKISSNSSISISSKSKSIKRISKIKKRDCWKILKRNLEGNDGIIRDIMYGSSIHSDSGSSRSDSESVFSYGTDSTYGNVDYYTRSGTSYSVELGSNLEAIRNPSTKGKEIIVPKINEVRYNAVPSKIMSDVAAIMSYWTKHTMASYELVQVMAEYSKKVFNTGAINKTRQSKRNWLAITTAMETTSIISMPIRDMSCTEYINKIQKQRAQKITKVANARLDHSKDAKSKDQKRELIDHIRKEMLLDGTFSEKIQGTVIDTLNKKLASSDSWKTIHKMNLEKTIFNDDANITYFWIKSLSRDIKHFKKSLDKRDYFEGRKLMLDIKKSFKEPLEEDGSDIDVTFKIKESYKIWLSWTEKILDLMEVNKPEHSKLETLSKRIVELITNYKALKNNKILAGEATLIIEEQTLINMEQSIVSEYWLELSQVLNILFIHVLVSPWITVLNNDEVVELHYKISTGLTQDFFQQGALKVIEYYRGLHKVLNLDEECSQLLIQYVVSMFHACDLPMRSQYVEHQPVTGTTAVLGSMIRQIRSEIAKQDLYSIGFDFFITLHTIKSKNFKYTQRVLNKSSGFRIPRSTRSKVLYELIKKFNETRHVVLQQQAFTCIMDPNQRCYAALAPKAQLGGDRDLLVQDTETKLMNATTENFSKALAEQSTTDALVHPYIKDQILEHSQTAKLISDSTHGRLVDIERSTDSSSIYFRKCYCISGDHTKWGPIHCCSIFSALKQQLLRDYPDWNNLTKLVNLKNLIKNIEIPVSSIEKYFKSFLYSKYYQEFINDPLDRPIEEFLDKSCKNWEWKPYMPFIYKNYVNKGIACLNSWNHMGQGIHHASSSNLGEVVRIALSEMVKTYFQKELPQLSVVIRYAGSSDDFSVVFEIGGRIKRIKLQEYEERVEERMLRCLAFWNIISKAAGMCVSEKTVISSVVNEMYSDFDLYRRTIPSVIKFIVGTLINSSITTPLTLYQSMHVASQQAIYMSTPYITNLAFCLFKQQIILSQCENEVRRAGPLMFRLPSSFGRLYVPKVSTLLSDSVISDDLEDCIKNLDSFLAYHKYAPLGTAISEKLPEISITEAREHITPDSEITDLNRYILEKSIQKRERKELGISSSSDEHKSVNNQLILEPNKQSKKHIQEEYWDDDVVHGTNEGKKENEKNEKNENKFSRIMTMYDGIKEMLGLDHDNNSNEESLSIEEVDGYSQTNSKSSSGVEPDDHLTEVQNDYKVSQYQTAKSTKEAFKVNFNPIDTKCSHINIETDSADEILACLQDEQQYNTFLEQVEFNSMTNGKQSEILFMLHSAKLYVIILNHYEYARSSGIEKSFKGSVFDKIEAVFEDPFTYLLPETVKQQLKKLRVVRSELEENAVDMEIINDPGQFIARDLTESNNATEDFLATRHRILQIVKSRNVIHGLAGGLRQQSLPILIIALRSFSFVNKTGIQLNEHWNQSKDTSYKLKFDEDIDGVQKVKYLSWLIEMSKVEFRITTNTISDDSITEASLINNPKVLLKSTRKTIDTYIGKKTKHRFVFNSNRLLELKNAIISFLTRISDHNKIELLRTERSPIDMVYPAKGAAVSKARLFSREGTFKLDNNPSFVLGHIIDPIGASSCKPVHVNYASITTDKSALLSHLPYLPELVDKIKNLRSASIKECKELVRGLSFMCRQLQSSTLKKTVFYAHTPVKKDHDTSINSIISFNLVEGLEYKIEQHDTFSTPYSDGFYRVKECLSMICSMPIDDSRKSKLMLAFLHWNPLSSSDSVLINGQLIECPNINIDKECLGKYSNVSISSMLLAESKIAQNPKERKQIQLLANLVNNSKDIGKDNRRTDLNLIFEPEGEPFTDGRFQLSCNYGSAVGVFLDSEMIITMSSKQEQLLQIVCQQVLRWCTGLRTEVVGREQMEEFIKLLAPKSKSEPFIKDLKGFTPAVSRQRDSYGFILLEADYNEKVIYIKPQLITTRTYNAEYQQRNPVIRWTKNCISVYIAEETTVIDESSYMPSVINVLTYLNHPKSLIESTKNLKEQRILIDKINLPSTVTKDTYQLMHIFFWHVSQVSTILPESRKENLKFLLDSKEFKQSLLAENSQQYIEKIMDDKTLDVINNFSLNKSTDSKEEKDYLKKLFKEGQTIEQYYKGRDYGKDEIGYYNLDDENERIHYFPGQEGYDDIVERYNRERNDPDLTLYKFPDILPEDSQRELVNTLVDRTTEDRIRDVKFQINRFFSDINSWPHVRMILDEIGLSNMSLIPTSDPISNRIKWDLIDTVSKSRLPAIRNPLESIIQIKSGNIPNTFSYSLISYQVPSLLWRTCNDFIERLSFTEVSRTAIMSISSLIIFLNDSVVNKERASFNWIEFLSNTLPIEFSTEDPSEGVIVIKVMSNRLAMMFNIYVPLDKTSELKKTVNGKLNKLKDSINKMHPKKHKDKLEKARHALKVWNTDKEVKSAVLLYILTKLRLLSDKTPEQKKLYTIEFHSRPTADGTTYSILLDRYQLSRDYDTTKFCNDMTNMSPKEIRQSIGFSALMLDIFFGMEFEGQIKTCVEEVRAIEIDKKKFPGRLSKNLANVSEPVEFDDTNLSDIEDYQPVDVDDFDVDDDNNSVTSYISDKDYEEDHTEEMAKEEEEPPVEQKPKHFGRSKIQDLMAQLKGSEDESSEEETFERTSKNFMEDMFKTDQ